jgi:glycosyltransferase involved in cell wall biosynthesis
MPAFNARAYIAEAIDSVLNQTYANWELIIIDDASTDNTIQIVKTFIDPRIKLSGNKHNLGPDKTTNIGMKNASGEYLTFLGADDLFTSQSLATRLNTIGTNQMIHCALVRFDHFGLYNICTPLDFNENASTIKFLEGSRNNLNCNSATVLFRRNCIDQVGLFNEDDKNFNSDYEYTLRLASSFSSITINEIVYQYRIRTNSTNALNSVIPESTVTKKNIEKKYLDIFKSRN